MDAGACRPESAALAAAAERAPRNLALNACRSGRMCDFAATGAALVALGSSAGLDASMPPHAAALGGDALNT